MAKLRVMDSLVTILVVTTSTEVTPTNQPIMLGIDEKSSGVTTDREEADMVVTKRSQRSLQGCNNTQVFRINEFCNTERGTAPGEVEVNERQFYQDTDIKFGLLTRE